MQDYEVRLPIVRFEHYRVQAESMAEAKLRLEAIIENETNRIMLKSPRFRMKTLGILSRGIEFLREDDPDSGKVAQKSWWKVKKWQNVRR